MSKQATDHRSKIDRQMSRLRITNRSIARRLDVQEATVSRWRSGKSTPQGHNLIALAHYLETTAEELI